MADQNLVFIYEIAKAQDENDFKLELIRHGRGHGPHHHMMEREDTVQPFNGSESVVILSDEPMQINSSNLLPVSIVPGAVSKTTDAYQPSPAYIRSGQTIIWTNDDNVIHTVTTLPTITNSMDIHFNFDSGILYRGESFVLSFGEEGNYHYYCTVHPWMRGEIIVTD